MGGLLKFLLSSKRGRHEPMKAMAFKAVGIKGKESTIILDSTMGILGIRAQQGAT